MNSCNQPPASAAPAPGVTARWRQAAAPPGLAAPRIRSSGSKSRLLSSAACHTVRQGGKLANLQYAA